MADVMTFGRVDEQTQTVCQNGPRPRGPIQEATLPHDRQHLPEVRPVVIRGARQFLRGAFRLTGPLVTLAASMRGRSIKCGVRGPLANQRMHLLVAAARRPKVIRSVRRGGIEWL